MAPDATAPDAAAPEGAKGDTRRAMTEDDARILNRLARIEGQVRGLQRMIEEGNSLDRVGTHLISHHMKDCLEDTTGAQLDPVALEKAFEVFFKYVQCMRS